MKLKSTLLLALASTAFVQAQVVVGDPSLGSYEATRNTIYSSSETQEYPKLIFNGDKQTVFSAVGSGPLTINEYPIDASNYVGLSETIHVDGTGNGNTQPLHAEIVTAFDPLSKKTLVVYDHNQVSGTKDFSIKAVLIDSNGVSTVPFEIEGPFRFSSESAGGGFGTSVAVSNTGVFCVAYWTSVSSSSSSKVKVKFVNASSGVVNPVASSTELTGFDVTSTGITHPPRVAWNDSGVFGLTYTEGSGNNRKIKFASVDVAGTVVTSPKDVVNSNLIETQYPTLYQDGEGFVMIWRDFRTVEIAPEAPVTGVPAVRIAQLSVTGDLIELTNADDEIFSDEDYSLLLTNPYTEEVSLHFDLHVIEERKEYLVTYATQSTPYFVGLVKVKVKDGSINASVASMISDETVNSTAPSIEYDELNDKVLVAYHAGNSIPLSNELAIATFVADPLGLSSNSETKTIEVFPNPTSGIINFAKNESKIEVLSLDGVVVKEFENTNKIDLSDLENKIYVLKVNGSHTKISLNK